MGFALWMERDVAWAEGRHEYRPMGTAVVAVSDLFRQRDFRPARKTIPAAAPSYVGLFASLGDMNSFLALARRRAPFQSQLRARKLREPVTG